ncbi:MAG: hypothetical protein QM775_00155 [Pirellulales bacterium]
MFGLPGSAYAGTMLLGAALLQAQRQWAAALPPVAQTWTLLLLAYSTLTLAAAVIVERFARRIPAAVLVKPLLDAAIFTSILVAPAIIFEQLHIVPIRAATAWAWLSAVWAVFFWRMPERGWFAMLQIASLAALGTLVHDSITRQLWYAEAWSYPALFDPRALQLFGFAAIGYRAAWLTLRR